MQHYKSEDFEKYMVHYYKAINYLQLGQPEEALVEARRITLRSNAQEDEKGTSPRYTSDAFAYMLQGLVYEKNRDINNAFIAYRNAADLYLGHKGNYYGIEMPLQLKKDLLRTAYLNGFTDELERYEQLCNLKYGGESGGDELILFWENGLAPIKKEQNLFFSLTDEGSGGLLFVDASGSFRIPFSVGEGDRKNLKALQAIRIAIPAYEQQNLQYREATLLHNDTLLHIEAAQNINNLALATLRQRMVKELTLTLSRVAVKKLAEIAAMPKDDDEKASKEKARKGLALGIKLFAFASEKADTRNWQSLPHSIHYTRVPLQQGTNQLSLKLEGNNSKQEAYNGRINIHIGGNACTHTTKELIGAVAVKAAPRSFSACKRRWLGVCATSSGSCSAFCSVGCFEIFHPAHRPDDLVDVALGYGCCAFFYLAIHQFCNAAFDVVDDFIAAFIAGEVSPEAFYIALQTFVSSVFYRNYPAG